MLYQNQPRQKTRKNGERKMGADSDCYLNRELDEKIDHYFTGERERKSDNSCSGNKLPGSTLGGVKNP
jgi:hypothetical protein